MNFVKNDILDKLLFLNLLIGHLKTEQWATDNELCQGIGNWFFCVTSIFWVCKSYSCLLKVRFRKKNKSVHVPIKCIICAVLSLDINADVKEFVHTTPGRLGICHRTLLFRIPYQGVVSDLRGIKLHRWNLTASKIARRSIKENNLHWHLGDG